MVSDAAHEPVLSQMKPRLRRCGLLLLTVWLRDFACSLQASSLSTALIGQKGRAHARMQLVDARKHEDATHRALGIDELVTRLGVMAVTHRGRRDHFDPKQIDKCVARNASEVEWRYAASRAAKNYGEDVSFLRSMDESVEVSLSRAERGLTLEIDELAQLRQVGIDLEHLCVAIDVSSPSALDRLRPPEDLVSAARFSPLPEALREVDGEWQLSELLFPELAKARAGERSAFARVERVKKGGDFFEFDGRFVVAVKRGQQPKGALVHGASRTGQTLYVEPPEVAEATNAWKAASSKAKVAETAVLVSLSNAVRDGAWALHRCLDLAADFDAVNARARLGGEGWRAPEISEQTGVVRVGNLRHALLALDQGNETIGNDVRLDADKRCLVISGANAGGKTVLLKSVGLAAFLVKLGAPLPADAPCEVAFFDTVLAHVGDAQELGLASTYVGHLRLVDSALRSANSGSLVLLDELGSGTDPEPGSALGAAVLEGLVERGALVVATTHHGPLKQLALTRHDFDIAAMTDGFRCEYGVSGESRAIDAARAVPLPPDIIDRAQSFLGNERLRIDDLAAQLEDARRRALNAEAEARAAQVKAQQALSEAVDAKLRADKAAQKARADAARVYERRLSELKRSQIDKEAIDAEATRARGEAQQATARSRGLEPLVAIPPVGTRIVVLKDGVGYRKTGIVSSHAGAKAVKVNLDGFDDALIKPLKLKPQDLALADESAQLELSSTRKRAPSKSLSRRAAAALSDQAANDIVTTTQVGPTVQMRTQRNTLDLRGRTLEDAQIESDNFLYRVKGAGFPSAFLLHGHGTGVLKRGLRTWLKSHPIARRANAAKEDDGGDAFTEVQF